MSRHFSLVLAGLFAFGCLDDDLDGTTHFLRAASDEVGDGRGASSDEAAADGGTPITPGKTTTLPDLDTFIAVDRDFEDFQSWTRFDLGKGSHVVDQEGQKRVYINALPRSGDTEFRVGTMIVKVLELGEAPNTWQVHAMVKRGGSYNTQGAFGWEYFDFTLDDEGIPRQNWRGETAPDGESYQTTVFTADGVVLQEVADCNQCHQTANNDAVSTPALNLDSW